jgi:hypothetical protein
MTDTPARDFLLPRLEALLAEAKARGISRDVAVAVLIDLVEGPGFNDTPLDPLEDTAPVRDEDAPLTAPEEEAERRDEQPVLTGPDSAWSALGALGRTAGPGRLFRRRRR